MLTPVSHVLVLKYFVPIKGVYDPLITDTLLIYGHFLRSPQRSY